MSSRLAVILSHVNLVDIPVWRLMLFTWAHQVDCSVNFLDFILYEFLISPLSCYMSHPSFSSWFYNAWCLLKIINSKLFLIVFFVSLPSGTLKSKPSTLSTFRFLSKIVFTPKEYHWNSSIIMVDVTFWKT
jgi:hypothetical protein